jgi:hypothetical protein
MRATRIAAGALLALAVAAGCAGGKSYPDRPEKNLRVLTSATGTSVVMGVHRLDANCRAHYEGVVTLDAPLIEIGLPPDQMSLLVFEFYGFSLMSGSRAMKREARLLPRAGHRYEARVIYKDSIYSVGLVEIDARGTAKELDSGRAAGC